MVGETHVDVIGFVYSALIACITSTVLALILFIYGKARIHRIFALFNLAIAWWGIWAFFLGRSSDPNLILFLFKIAHCKNIKWLYFY